VGLPLLALGITAHGGVAWAARLFSCDAAALPAGAVRPERDSLAHLALPLVFLAGGGALARHARAFIGARRSPREAAGDTPQPAATRAPSGLERAAFGWRDLMALLLLQASFSRRHLQRGGFLQLLANARRRMRAPGEREALDALERDLVTGRPPNTHPLLAAALTGALDRALREAGASAPPRPLHRLLEVGGAALAPWGDRCLWSVTRPLLALAALAVLPLRPGFVLAVYGMGVLGLQLFARHRLYAWGGGLGWDLPGTRPSRVWRACGRHGDLIGAIAALAASLSLGAWLGAGAVLRSGSGPLVILCLSGILGILSADRLGRRAEVWGWACWVAGVLAGAVLDWWL